MVGVRFIRLRGKIIPLINRHRTVLETGAAVATFAGAAAATQKSRNVLAERFRGHGRRGFGSAFSNAAYDAVLTSGLSYAAIKHIPAVKRGFLNIHRIMRGGVF